MWPNQNNLASFGIEKKNILQKKFYIYKIVSNLNYNKNIKNYSINELTKYKKYFQKNNSFLLKNFTYFKNRYLSYKKHEYVINKFEYKNSISFIVLKKNKDKSGTNFVILDHFGSKEIYQRHLSFLINNQNKLIFLSKKLLKKNNCLLMSKLNLKIGVIKKLNIKKKNFLKNKNIFLGDTDTFISI
jgi:hypothetical protein